MARPASSAGPRLGSVTTFDGTRGLGTVADATGTTYGFHATAIADGTRRIEPGAAVAFAVAPGHRGLYEARSVLPLPY
jgi:cold shock CspA family protein